MAKKPEPQALIVNRVLRGSGTSRDIEQAKANFRQWMVKEWGGSEYRAIAACVGALATACGSDWSTIEERDKEAHIWLFGFLCPSPDDIHSEAGGYRDEVLVQGGFHRFAVLIRRVQGIPE
ncbi:hypothetical protein OG535_06385 [Kitasatospora sp. NBC_00085]|uniref:hypothetical protein n=1 Tax=unclassified Kitasatospora TaxID=2633591 RepID=UPI00324A41F9